MSENNFFASIEKTEKSKSTKNTLQAQARQHKMAYIGASVENGRKMHIVLWYAKYAKKAFLQALDITPEQAQKERVRINAAKASALLKLYKQVEHDAFVENSNAIIDLKSINLKSAKVAQA